MASSEYADRQKFESEDGTPLASPRSHPCAADMKKKCIFWSDVQRTFQGVDHLKAEGEQGERILFMIDDDGELYVLS